MCCPHTGVLSVGTCSHFHLHQEMTAQIGAHSILTAFALYYVNFISDCNFQEFPKSDFGFDILFAFEDHNLVNLLPSRASITLLWQEPSLASAAMFSPSAFYSVWGIWILGTASAAYRHPYSQANPAGSQGTVLFKSKE